MDKRLEKAYLNFEPVQYRMKSRYEDDFIRYGLLAQDVEDAINREGMHSNEMHLVEYTENNEYNDDSEFCQEGYHYRLNYENLHAMHIMLIQKHQKEIEYLKRKIERMEN